MTGPRYQILQRRKAGRGEEREKWAFRAHGARYCDKESRDILERLPEFGLEGRRIRI